MKHMFNDLGYPSTYNLASSFKAFCLVLVRHHGFQLLVKCIHDNQIVERSVTSHMIQSMLTYINVYVMILGVWDPQSTYVPPTEHTLLELVSTQQYHLTFQDQFLTDLCSSYRSTWIWDGHGHHRPYRLGLPKQIQPSAHPYIPPVRVREFNMWQKNLRTARRF